ncbi:MAG: hypothetical protein GY749_27610, partial [Desulfobacteraceae bacterium]|nr:hypothetical protein [Desulfobacteraceae bacterium]
MDEFDSLEETFINKFAGMFRSIYTDRRNEPEKETCEKTYLLHGCELIIPLSQGVTLGCINSPLSGL